MLPAVWAGLGAALCLGLWLVLARVSSAPLAGLTAEQSAREVFKQRVAYPRRMEPATPLTLVVKHRCGGGGKAAHAEQTRKWV
jgi:hypothetical protein